MDRIQILVNAVEEVYAQVSERFNSFQKENNLSCTTGCGHCCHSPTIECSTLEMIPFAYHLFLQGNTQPIIDKITTKNSPTCILFQALDLAEEKGFCTQYEGRPSICRMFGAWAKKSKNGQYQLSLCKVIKKNHTGTILVNELEHTLDMSYWRSLIVNIDPRLGEELLPINQAIQKAIEYIEDYYYYLGFSPDNKKSIFSNKRVS